MFRLLMLIGLLLFLPGLLALGVCVSEGPSAWMTDGLTFWGTPISLFVFWIGLAHAGTLLSAIFVALDVKIDRRTALLAELSTLCCLFIAAIFPLVHLGVIDNFYMVAPFLDGRDNLCNFRSPLVWDFCCIAVYAILSFLFFVMHLGGRTNEILRNVRKSMAWLLFPLVLWVHTIVSLDFATTFVPQWRGAFFPLYFIVGAIYSGVALVNLLISVENYSVRLLEKLMLSGSWILGAFYLWNFILKGDFCVSAFIFACLLPQLLFVRAVRESRLGKNLVNLSVILGLLLERIFLVSPELQNVSTKNFGWIDWGLVAFGLGLFFLLFFGLRQKFSSAIENDEVQMGEVNVEELAEIRSSKNIARYFPPLTTPEFRTMRLPLLLGVLVALVYFIWALNQSEIENFHVIWTNLVPISYPIVALVAGVILSAVPLWSMCSLKIQWTVFLGFVLFAAMLGAAYAGKNSVPENELRHETRAQQNAEIFKDSLEWRNRAASVWNVRCATCHGVDGKFNEKFIREFYPVPQKLTLERLDTLGEDSLVHVILHGRINMNPYADRLTENEARGLVRYMRILASEHEASAETLSSEVEK